MADVNLIINGQAIAAPVGSTVLAAAEAAGIRIPTLCAMKELDPNACCRICVVEIDGARTLQHACATKVREGMVVRTDTERVRASRKLTLELLLAHHSVDCHHCLRIGNSRVDDLDPKLCESCFFCDCVRDGFCELQSLAREYKVDKLPFEIRADEYTVDASTPIVRNPNKCIKCRRCVDICNKVQTVHNLCITGRGVEVQVAPAFNKAMAESDCVRCGRCVEVCPCGAVSMQEHKDEVLYAAHAYDTVTAAMITDGGFKVLNGILAEKYPDMNASVQQVAGSLKKTGINHVVDYECVERAVRADAEQLLKPRLGKELVILANDLAAENFLEKNFSDMKDAFAFYPSAQEKFGELAKAAYAVEGKKLVLVNICPFGSDAAQAEKSGSVDYAVNGRELYRIMVRTGSEPHPGRVAEPEILSAAEPAGELDAILMPRAWNMSAQAEILELKIKRKSIRCAICSNLGQARKVLDSIRAGEEKLDVVRVIG